METNIQLSAKGNRAAMTQLVDANAATVYFLAKALLKSAEQAAPAANWALQTALQATKSGAVRTEEEFTDYAINQAAGYCKKEVAKKDPRAFRLPPNKDFRISHIHERMIHPDATAAENCARCLPALQRFTFVLRHLGNMTEPQIATVLGLDSDTVSLIAAAEQENLAKICSISGEESVSSSFTDALSSAEVPNDVKTCMEAYIDSVAAPLEKSAKRKGRTLGIVTGAIVLCALVLVAAFAGKNQFTTTTSDDGGETDSATTEATDPAHTLDSSLIYYADIAIKDYGTITVKLEPASAPVTVANFVQLAERGFYNGLTFHRIIKDFMMQGGDPKGNGTGGSGKNIVGEFAQNGHGNTLTHTRGALSMARATPYNSATSQFFIVHKDQPDLDGLYAVFGYVTEGIDVVDAICTSAKPLDSNGSIAKKDQPVMTSVTIRTEPVKATASAPVAG